MTPDCYLLVCRPTTEKAFKQTDLPLIIEYLQLRKTKRHKYCMLFVFHFDKCSAYFSQKKKVKQLFDKLSELVTV